jgi:hypothetical protein
MEPVPKKEIPGNTIWQSEELTGEEDSLHGKAQDVH